MSRYRNSGFRHIKPVFFSGLLDDPVLVLYLKSLKTSLMVDCGQTHHIAKRVLKSVSCLFISHAHMDHLMGFDKLVRSLLVSPKTLDVFGPPGIATKLRNKLAAYDWNLVEDYYCNIRVLEVNEDFLRVFILKGSKGFEKSGGQRRKRKGRLLFENELIKVNAVTLDHKIPVLAFRFEEKPSFTIDTAKMKQQGFVGGKWIQELKSHFMSGSLEKCRIKVPLDSSKWEKAGFVVSGAELYQTLKKERKNRSLGYLTDIGWNVENKKRVLSFLDGVDYLVSECSYLSDHLDKAKSTFHLSTQDINEILDHLKPEIFMPMHLSKSYSKDTQALYKQLVLPKTCELLTLPDRRTAEPLNMNQINQDGLKASNPPSGSKDPS